MYKTINHIFLCITSVLWTTIAVAQPDPPSNLFQEELRVWLQENWHEGYHDGLGYNQARMQMYGYIDNEDGMIECVYTGFTQEGGYVTYPNPINAEHIVPQSFFGSAEPMKSDIYILKPCHGNANSSRSNNPFGEVNDASAQWYGVVGNTYTTQGNMPSNHELWSEKSGNIWEPREEHKGNIARSVFYFYTMYPESVGDISQVGNPEILYQWHLDDPVDAMELERNDKIELHQGNRNPYVDHPGLVWSAWFQEEVVDTDGPEITGESVIYLDCTQYPNDEIYVVATDENGPVTLTYVDYGTPGGCEYNMYRSYTAVDALGNTTSFTQQLIVMDTSAPTFSQFDDTIIVDCSSDELEIPVPEASDLCSAVTITTTEEIIGDGCPYAHQIIRTFTAVDECGNASTATQTVIVNEYIPPVGCNSDLDNNGYVTVDDILLALSEFGCPSNCNYDVDGDGFVGVSDILGILADFGNAC
ncbi:MAG: hypothetical protein CMB32_02355 [Euryarchaeota archaeon]|nr:hypothetical protein [Euryarchaeota archaeon]|tara:strand:+ start:6987 stop:8405 length:1419 start_codon:yes stop_codon:yes gene_type:complete